MNLNKIITKTRSSRVKTLLKQAKEEIKKASKQGEYSTQITILDIVKDNDPEAHSINLMLFTKLTNIGFRLGAGYGGDKKYIFWEPNKNK